MRYMAAALGWFFSASLWAEVEKKPTINSGQLGGEIAWVLVSLLAVIGLIFLMAWLVKRVNHPAILGDKTLRVISSYALGAREKITLVEVGDKHILLGVTAHNINTLHVFEEKIPVSQITDSAFANKLKGFLQSGSSVDQTKREG